MFARQEDLADRFADRCSTRLARADDGNVSPMKAPDEATRLRRFSRRIDTLKRDQFPGEIDVVHLPTRLRG